MIGLEDRRAKERKRAAGPRLIRRKVAGPRVWGLYVKRLIASRPAWLQYPRLMAISALTGKAPGLCSVGVSFLAVAGGVRVSGQEFYVENWRQQDGLPDGQITAIEQTPDGYLWIGTSKGLARFDGVSFKVFKAGDTRGFTDSRISSLKTDLSGTLWVGMLDGNLAQRQLKGGFTELQPPLPKGLSMGMPRLTDTWLWDRRTAMIEDAEGGPHGNGEHVSDHRAQLTLDADGAIWWQISGVGLARFKAGEWTAIEKANNHPAASINQLASGRQGPVWFDVDGQLEAYQDVQRDSSLPSVALNGRWCTLAPSTDGGLWVAEPRNSWSGGGRVRKWIQGKWRDELPPIPPAPRASRAIITCLLEDRAERIWYGTISGGVFFSDHHGEWQRLRPQGLFSQGYISCLYEDRQGSIWVGTVGDGLYRVAPQPVTMLKLPPPFESAEINTTCAAHDGSIWIGTGGNGAIHYQDGSFTAVGAEQGLTNPHVCALFEDSHSDLWAGTSGGLFKREGGRFVAVQGPPELSVWVKAFHEDRAGRLWIGTLAGLICAENGQFSVHYLPMDRSHCDIRSIAEDPVGNLWIGTIGQGLFCIPLGQGDNLHRVEKFPAADVRSLYCGPDGVLWIGGWGSGLFRMEGGRFTNFTTEDGLPSNRIQSILTDDRGQLWMSSDNGLIGLTPQVLQDFKRGTSPPIQCRHLSLEDGLASGVCSGSGQPVSTRTADGRLWFPDFEGVALIDPRNPGGEALEPNVLIEAVLADGKELPQYEDGSLMASSGTRRFEFEYTAPNLSSRQNLRFRHKLVGMDNDWVDAGAQRFASYSQLPPGDYQFHVMVGGSDNQWHIADPVIALHIIPRLWERPWLRALAAGLVVGIVGGGIVWSQRRRYQLRLERLKMRGALEDERRRIARDLHDEFGSSLTGVALQGEAAMQAEAPGPGGETALASMTRSVRQLIGMLNEVVWTTDPANDSLANVVAFLCDHAEDFVSRTNTRFRLEVPPRSELPAVSLTAQTRHNLLMAAKEALNNSIRHANAQSIQLRIAIEANRLVVEIKDDGRGFNTSTARPGGHGLSNLKSRMELLQGRASIESQPGTGTTITLTTPLAPGGDHTRTSR